jgi:hypothetical protein
MARTKTIKEVEVKFSPAFDKAINGVKTPKKTAKPKAKAKVKAKTKTAKPKAKTAGPRKPRGYTITPVTKELTMNGVTDTYNLFELAGPKMDKPRFFVTEAHAKRAIEDMEGDKVVVAALSGKGYQHIKGVIAAHKELESAADLPELDTDRPEKCDKTSIEDIDA